MVSLVAGSILHQAANDGFDPDQVGLSLAIISYVLKEPTGSQAVDRNGPRGAIVHLCSLEQHR